MQDRSSCTRRAQRPPWLSKWHQILRSGQGPIAPRTARTLCASVPLGQLFFFPSLLNGPSRTFTLTSGNVFQPSENRFLNSQHKTHHTSEAGSVLAPRSTSRVCNSGSDRRKTARSREYEFSLLQGDLTSRVKGEHGCHLLTPVLKKNQQDWP